MDFCRLSHHVTRRTYLVVTVLVRLLSVFVLILVGAFIFLRIYGVPDPILHELVKRANNAGIPINIGHLTLTLRGWRAFDVQFYSKHPDDLVPVFQAEEVLFTRRMVDEDLSEWQLDIEAVGIRLNPSVEWGIEIPKESATRDIEAAKLSLGFFPDKIELTSGTLFWLGAQFNVSGIILKSTKSDKVNIPTDHKPVLKEGAVLPVYVNSKQFQGLERLLKTVQVHGGFNVVVDFVVDTHDYAASRINFYLNAEDFLFNAVPFSSSEIKGSYVYPKLEIQHAQVAVDTQSIWFEGDYSFDTGELLVKIENKITSIDLLKLIPQTALTWFSIAHLDFKALPQFKLTIGPAKPVEVLNSLSGSFSIREVTYFGLLIESAEGKIVRRNDRLDLSELTASVAGQENRSETIGSCMTGGFATGSVFWDASSHEFGVSASGSMDPNLMLKPLSMVRIATNVIDRFKFPDVPPEISLKLGANYTDWRTFYIDIQGISNRIRIHEGELSSLNTAAFYKHGILTLDPVAATLGADFLKGKVALDFINSTAIFDAGGSLPPAVVEDVIYPGFNLFGKSIITPAVTKISARGSLDWATMQATDFIAEVEAERLEIPITAVDSFSAIVSGKGPVISVQQAAYGFCGGTGTADFSIRLDPCQKGMPYKMSARVEFADFNKALQCLNAHVSDKITGTMSGELQYEADMSVDFFSSANGKGQVIVEKGQLADLPLFSGFSRLIRRIIPGFNIFSITSLRGSFDLKNGMIYSDDAYFEGDVISAKGYGSYSKQKGFDAKVQAQILRDNAVSKFFRVITDPFFKLFELKLEGRLSEPTWKLEKFHGTSDKPSAEDDGISH